MELEEQVTYVGVGNQTWVLWKKLYVLLISKTLRLPKSFF